MINSSWTYFVLRLTRLIVGIVNDVLMIMGGIKWYMQCDHQYVKARTLSIVLGAVFINAVNAGIGYIYKKFSLMMPVMVRTDSSIPGACVANEGVGEGTVGEERSTW